ncbi:hypothetical protein GCM10007415_00110 [Parapedobacter pyrenivorans]|uniref:Uncharacterized protein n=1 Tax=Parapedobacter pyrenivorans TaxID=1305674 RepID=A0A917HAE3_9SPHI|nr:hypothetical protein [Parapedobacter pyrenivorans]GGG72807.1 hypothetical protein GCM10007415_00110 [Parapedobacter pyrenivorans]
MDFERMADNRQTPALWKTYGEGHDIKIDLDEKYEGEASLSIQSIHGRSEKDSIALVGNRMEPINGGKEVQLTGYLKLSNIRGRAGFSVTINGKHGLIAGDEMITDNLHGTKPWGKYSISMPLPDSATSIDIAVYLIGDGQLWADQLELLIDGQDISSFIGINAESHSESHELKKFIDDFGHVIKSDILLNDATSLITYPPREFGFNPHYKKYLNASGLPILGSEDVSDEAFYKAREIVFMMLKKNPLLKVKLIDNNARIAIIGRNEQMTDLPEYKGFDQSINERARGMGGWTNFPLTSCGEENILCLDTDRYWGEDILIHEFAHAVHMLGISFIDSKFNEELHSAYNQALKNGLWHNTYAISSPQEYFAEGVQSWFDVNKNAETGDGIHNHVNTNAELKLYDPELYSLIGKYFTYGQQNVSCHNPKNEHSVWRFDDMKK